MKLSKPRYYLFYHPERRNPYLFLRYKGKRKCNYRKKKKKKKDSLKTHKNYLQQLNHLQCRWIQAVKITATSCSLQLLGGLINCIKQFSAKQGNVLLGFPVFPLDILFP